jgi:hypothetical protein
MLVAMETSDRIFRRTCTRCARPALTFDEQHRPLCSRHATVFVAAKRRIAADDEWWENLWSEASCPPDG